MGNGITKIRHCFAGAGEISRRHDIAVVLSDPLDEGIGHSFCYIRPDPYRISSSKVHNEDEMTTFRSISGASVSANVSTPLSTAAIDTNSYSSSIDRAAAFDCSTSFASLPLQPVPRSSVQSGSGNLGRVSASGPVERGFLSGPIERGFVSGPIDRGLYSDSGPIEKGCDKLQRSFSYREVGDKLKSNKRNLIRVFQRLIAKAILRSKNGVVHDSIVSSANLSNQMSLNDEDHGDGNGDEVLQSQNLQWAEGKAGEDRVHVVISEEHEWVFVGIYDGFNGPDAPDYLLSNLYSAVHRELKGLLWNEIDESQTENLIFDKQSHALEHRDLGDKVLKALSQALRKTEESYLEIADKMVDENPELALMGSCVLVMLMKGEDVYMMNVGDSRAVLARTARPELGLWKSKRDLVTYNGDEYEISSRLTSLQLTLDHSTYVEEEVKRIKNDHPDDTCAILNDRVKGYLKVTRAFGAGFLKQPRWNDALLEMFRIDYIGNSPYITCLPFLYHHKLGQNDRFLILSSDGLYQYFTNEEVIYEVESFITSFPEGDPAQHLIEEVLFRAARKAGMDFHELLDIPQGDRRRYHDDVSIIIISLEGRIWRSSV